MDTWHYRAEIISMEDMRHPDKLNELGDLGWELIAIERLQGTQPQWLVVFKKLLSN